MILTRNYMFSLREPTLIIINNTLISHYFFSEHGKHRIDKNFRFFRDFCVQRKKETNLSFVIFLHNFSFSSGKSSIFASSNKVDTPSLLHINSISCPSFRWSIYGQTMVKRWSMLRVRTNYFRKEKIWLK